MPDLPAVAISHIMLEQPSIRLITGRRAYKVANGEAAETRTMHGDATDLYTTDLYLEKNPSLHLEDSSLKVEKLYPLVARSVRSLNGKEMTLLDVGGGAGMILKEVSRRIEGDFGIKVNKISLDLSPGALDVQRRTNPDLRKALNEDIRATSLKTKEVDLTLVIDVLEHVPSPDLALMEIGRVSKFVLLKLPLENNLYSNFANILTRGRYRRRIVEQMGHINYYDLKGLLGDIEKNCGRTVDWQLHNAFEEGFRSEQYEGWNIRQRFPYIVGRYVYKLSPRLCSLIFTDHIGVLVDCYGAPLGESGGMTARM